MATAAARKIIPIYSGRSPRSATFIAPSKTSLTRSELHQAESSLRGTLPSGWQTLFAQSVRRAGSYWTVPNLCPHCGEVPPQGMRSALQRRRYMFVHVASCPHRQ